MKYIIIINDNTKNDFVKCQKKKKKKIKKKLI